MLTLTRPLGDAVFVAPGEVISVRAAAGDRGDMLTRLEMSGGCFVTVQEPPADVAQRVPGMLRLTQPRGDEVYVAAKKIVSFRKLDPRGGACLTRLEMTAEHYVTVRETPDVIARMREDALSEAA